ncbi:hypothetical protein HK097_000188 [Rhizophlyctis rosea]|uniref:SH3 domain-containing protein n=1 Tax=Rhizophlyctis rosea TaxID=64517 RepID=A0AAD5SHY6_9FUNG|nr:hypothetical protein HK097_000188 [Rhizophlyctis rosea]
MLMTAQFGLAYGIFHCNQDGRVTSLNITERAPPDIVGAAFGQLTALEELYADGNGWLALPSDLSYLSHLRILHLDRNQISDISSLAALKSLNSNQLTSIPDALSNMPELHVFNARSNQVTGSFPNVTLTWPKLTHLDLGQNHLEGSLPLDWGQATGIQSLRLDGNSFDGAAPESIATLSSLSDVNIAGTNVCGAIPNNTPCSAWSGTNACLAPQRTCSDSSSFTTCTNELLSQCPGAKLLSSTNIPNNTTETQAIFTSTGEDLVPHIAGGAVGALFGIVAIISSIKYWKRGSTTPNRKKTNYGTSNFSVLSGGTGLLKGKESLDGSVGSRSMESRERPFGGGAEESSLTRSASLLIYKDGPPSGPPLLDVAAGVVEVPTVAQGTGYDPMRRRFRIVRGHRPRNPDELALVVGQVVTVEKAFQDQWCLGWNHRNGHRGMFPLSCTAIMESSDVEESRGASDSPNEVGPKNAVLNGALESSDVVRSHRPDLVDEMALREGQKVVVEHYYRDGWCLGYNETTNDRGLFPLACIEKKDKLAVDTSGRASMESVTSTLMMESPASDGHNFDTIRLDETLGRHEKSTLP